MTFLATWGFSQNAPIDFEPGGFGDTWTWATFEAPMGEPNPTFSVVANPSVDAVNPSANVAKIDISYGTMDNWGKAGCESMRGADLGVFQFDSTNSTVKVLVYQEGFAAPVALKFSDANGAALPEVVVANTVADAWVEITFDMSAWINFPENNPEQFIFFPSYAPRTGGHVVYFDNARFSAGGGGGGGPVDDPMTSAPDPTIDESKVLSVYSNYYMMNTVQNFNFNAFQGGMTVSEVDIESDGNLTGKLENIDFYGAQWDAVDVTTYNYVHLNYYATSSTSFSFYLIDETAAIPGGNPEEPRYTFADMGGDEMLETGTWKSVFIPLTHFTSYNTPNFSYDLTDIFQYKFDGNGTVYFDNVYFTTDIASSIDDIATNSINIFPNPTQGNWNIQIENTTISSVELFDISGKKVLSVEGNNASQIAINGSELKAGLYVAKVTTPAGISSTKLIKE